MNHIELAFQHAHGNEFCDDTWTLLWLLHENPIENEWFKRRDMDAREGNRERGTKTREKDFTDGDVQTPTELLEWLLKFDPLIDQISSRYYIRASSDGIFQTSSTETQLELMKPSKSG